MARVIVAGCGALVAGCDTLKLRSPIAHPAEPKVGAGEMTYAELQSELMSFTDTFCGAIEQQWNQAGNAGRSGQPDSGTGGTAASPDARGEAHHRKLTTVTAAVSIATSPNSLVALADMITLITLERELLEGPETVEVFGPEAASGLVEVYREHEAHIWRIGARAFTPDQQQELKDLIRQWREEHPDQKYVSRVRLEDFSRAREQAAPVKEEGGSLLSLVMLDPLASLEPAAREAQRSRLLGERMFYYGARAPTIIKWEAQSLYMDFFRAPEVRQAVASMEQVSRAADRISEVAARLPEDIAAERQAALDQAFNGLTEQRQALVRELDEGQNEFRDTLGDFRETVAATKELTASITTTLHAAESFADRVMPPPDATGAASGTDSALAVIAEYRSAAVQTSDAVNRLNVLADKVERLLDSPAWEGQATTLEGAVAEVRQSSQEVIDYAFTRLLIVVLAAPFAVAAAAALYRWTARREDPPRRTGHADPGEIRRLPSSQL